VAPLSPCKSLGSARNSFNTGTVLYLSFYCWAAIAGCMSRSLNQPVIISCDPWAPQNNDGHHIEYPKARSGFGSATLALFVGFLMVKEELRENFVFDKSSACSRQI
jgi:hypothetical protein